MPVGLERRGCGGSASSVDRTPPDITLKGASTVDHEHGPAYSGAGETATDAEDGPVPVVTSGSAGADAGIDGFGYTIPDTFSEVFDGIGIGDSSFADIDA